MTLREAPLHPGGAVEAGATGLPRKRCLGDFAIGDTLTASVTVIARDPDSASVQLACRVVSQDGHATIEEGNEAIASDRHGEIRPGPGARRLPGIGPDDLPRLLEHVRPMGPIRVAVIHPCDALSLAGALDARAAGLIEPVLVAPRAKLQSAAKAAGLDLNGSVVEEVPHSHAAAARGAELAARGEVEALMKGSLHSDELMGAVLRGGLRTKRRISHCFLMQTPAYPRPFLITDAAVNIAPDLEAKADIVRNAIDLARVIGVDQPRVAILAATETIHVDMPATLDAAALCKMADRGQITGGLVDGPLALDNAVSQAAARIKGIASPVAGRADVLVVPDLESGNMLAKQLEHLGHAASAGIVMGARVPIVLTSRADSRESRIASCAIALMLAHHHRTAPP